VKPHTANVRSPVAVVTGGARGIGRMIARELAAIGAAVHSADVRAPDVRDTSDTAIIDVVADVTNEAAVEELLDRVVAHQGQLDILVNNAGVLVSSRFRDVSREDWTRVIRVNQEAVFFVSQQAARRMSAGASIVHVVSTSAFVASCGQAVYEASKAAVAMLTRSMALELAPEGIRVNAVAPGLIDTPLTRALFGSTERLPERVVEKVPLGRAGRPEEIARVVAFLVSSDAAYMTGQTLIVDGGWMLV
jgi:NAD(P)-dependent dehydrogenase (short-subunit alcohol dehydrogenase family)